MLSSKRARSGVSCSCAYMLNEPTMGTTYLFFGDIGAEDVFIGIV